MKKLFCLLFLVPVFVFGHNLKELLDLSIKNKLVDSSIKRIESIQSEKRSVIRGYLPTINVGVTGSATRSDEDLLVPQKSINSNVSLDLIVYDGGKREGIISGYEYNLSSANQDLNSLKNQLSLKVISYYYNYLSFIGLKSSKIAEIEQLLSQKERLMNFLQVGKVTKDEVDKIVSSIEIANVQLHEIELELQTILHNLEYITGQKVVIDEGSTIKNFKELGDSQLRRDIRSLEDNLEVLKSNIQIEESGFYPIFSINNTFSHSKDYFKEHSLDNSVTQNTLSATISWNLFSFGKTKNSYESKQKEYLSSVSNFEYEKNKSEIDLKLSLRSYDIAVLKLNSSLLAFKAADSAYEVIKEKYENGMVDNVSFLSALSNKTNAMNEVQKSKNDIEIKKSEVIYNSGKDLFSNIVS